MKSKLISFILTLCLLIAIPVSALYKYNPFTRKLDYYEPVSGSNLGDLGDVTLTGLATGNVLYYNGTAWVNLATGANTQVLTLAAGIPAWQAIPAGVTTFVGLNDTPANYVGKAGQLVRVNAAPDGLEFFAGSAAGTVIVADGSGGWTKDENFNIVSGKVSAGGYEGTAIANLYIAGIDQNLLTSSTPSFNKLILSNTVNSEDDITIANESFSFVGSYAGANKNLNWSMIAPATKGIDFTWYADATGVGSWVPSFTVSVHMSDDVGWQGIFLSADAPINFSMADTIGGTSDFDDYIQFKTVSHVPEITTVGAADLKITASSGTIDFDNELIKTIGEAEVKDITISTPVNVYGLSHNSFADYDANKHVDHTAVSVLSGGLITGGGTIDGNQTLTLTEATIEGAIDTLGAILFTGDVTFNEDVFITWADSADHMAILQEAATGIEDQALINITDEREGDTVDEVGEATLVLNADGPTYSFYIQDGHFHNAQTSYFAGDTYQYEDVFITWADALDKMVIHQAAVAGTEDQPLIFINDDRTGATVSESSEATIYIETNAVVGLYISGGYGIHLDGNAGLTSAGSITAESTIIWSSKYQMVYDFNGVEDYVFSWRYYNFGANDSSAIFLSQLNPSGMTFTNDWESPTILITNTEGADVMDYAGVVIGERAQADVTVAHYFDFYATVQSADGILDPTATELAAIFRFGASGSATPDNATTPGDVLFEGNTETDGTIYANGGIVHVVSKEVNFDDGSPVAIATVADGYMVTCVIVEITTTWDGTGTIVVGDGNDPDGYLEDGNITQGAAAYYGWHHDERGTYLWHSAGAGTGHDDCLIYTGADTIDATLVSGTSTQGVATVYVHLIRLK